MDINTTVPKVFEAYAAKNPEHLAILHNEQQTTYSKLNEMANQLARLLKDWGIKADMPVIVCMERSTDLLVTMFAILKAGGAYLPVDITHPEDRLEFIVSDSNASIIITKEKHKYLFKNHKNKMLLLDNIQSELLQYEKINLKDAISPNQLAYIIYTSGSTGNPKGVLVEHKNVVNYWRWFEDFAAISPGMCIDFSISHIFDIAVTNTIVALMSGLVIAVCDDAIKKNMKAFVEFLHASQINIIKFTPSYFKLFINELQNNPQKLTALHTVILAGESAIKEDCAAWLALYPDTKIYNEYGPTEATVAVTQFTITTKNIDKLKENVPIGKFGPDMHGYIIGKNNQELGTNEQGELCIAGESVARGYLNRDKLTKEKFITLSFENSPKVRVYKTGDLCFRNEDDDFEYICRIDNQIKIRGFRVEPSEIAVNLKAYPEIDSVVVLALDCNKNDKQLVAYYTQKNNKNTPLSFNKLRKFLANKLPEYMLPAAFVYMDEFPLNKNGKLDKAAFKKPDFTSHKSYKAPKTALEKKLTKIFETELGVSGIGVDDEFLELGGHSLIAARIVSEVNNKLNKCISINDIYEASSISKLLPRVEKATIVVKESMSEQTIANVLPLSDFQMMIWLSHIFESKVKKLNIVARKRIYGELRIDILKDAFNIIAKRQKALRYKPMRLKPLQYLLEDEQVFIKEEDLRNHPQEGAQTRLTDSLEELRLIYPWPRGQALVMVRLFYLENNEIELQISMPHIICDDCSGQILFTELADIYQQLAKGKLKNQSEFSHYQDYIVSEQGYLESYLDRDIQFWDNYLQNASLVRFPDKYVIKDMEAKAYAYSTYQEIAPEDLLRFKYFCHKNQLSLHDGLCAAFLLAIFECSDSQNKETPYTYINIVKSTRDDPKYDGTIGCFLRIEAIKIADEIKQNLLEVAAQIKLAKNDTAAYQRCPSLIKLVSTYSLRQKQKKITSIFINFLMELFSTFNRLSATQYKIFKYCVERLVSFERSNTFLINLNIQSNFTNELHDSSKFAGLDVSSLPLIKDDLLSVDSVLDICFLRDEVDNKPYLVVSANLVPAFREIIAKKIIQKLSSSVVVRAESFENT